MMSDSKLNEEAEVGSEGQLTTSIRDSANQIWLAGLGAFAKAQKEGSKMFDALVKEGEDVQSRAKKSAGEQMAEIRSKAMGTWDKLEQVFESRVERALNSLNVPTKKDIESLSKRVSELTSVSKKLSEAMEEAQASTSRAATRTRAATKRTASGSRRSRAA